MDELQEKALTRALRDAYKLEIYLRRDSRDPNPKPYQVVFRALQTAMATLSRVPDREKGWLTGMRTAWPGISTTALENEIMGLIMSHMRAVEVDAGGPEPEPKAGPLQAAELTRMMAVFEVYRDLLVGPKKGRDWKLLCLYASGSFGSRFARTAHSNKQFARQRTTTQCQAIAVKLKRIMPVDLYVSEFSAA